MRGHARTYDLRGGTSGPGVLVTDDDNNWCADGQGDAVAAHYLQGVVWDYYLTAHGRRGIRGDGRGACSQLHYGVAYANAFWSDMTGCMTYGSGAQGDARALLRIDVAAHEMTHGVTSATAGLVYSGEPGGLNEATSDIFAVAAEFAAHNANDPGDYLIGETLDIDGRGTALRYMDRPSCDGRSKDYWYPGIGAIDVHLSSGPANHFFYLLAEGSGAKMINGVSYDSPTYDGSRVTGIGREAAAKIWYRALTTTMTSTTNYRAARDLTLRAAADLYGAGSAQYAAVGAAWAAVNVK